MEREENGEEGKRGEKIQGQILKSESYSQTNFFFVCSAAFTAALLAQTNLNSLQNKMTGRWKDNVYLNIIDQPLSWHSQHGESLLYTASFNHLRQGFS